MPGVVLPLRVLAELAFEEVTEVLDMPVPEVLEVPDVELPDDPVSLLRKPDVSDVPVADPVAPPLAAPLLYVFVPLPAVPVPVAEVCACTIPTPPRASARIVVLVANSFALLIRMVGQVLTE